MATLPATSYERPGAVPERDEARPARPAMRNGRCRLHGGLSTGPKTAEGIERIRRALTTHGRYTQGARAERQYARALFKEARAMLAELERGEGERGEGA